MIDFGVTKMMLIGVVALVVIGPEKLPKVARMAGSLFGRAQRYINEVKAEVSREMELDEFRKMHDDIRQAAGEVRQSISGSISEVEDDLNAAWRDPRDEPAIMQSSLADRDAAQLMRKVKNFRKKKLASEAVPNWYKHKSGRKTRVVSAAARVARYRPSGPNRPTFFH
jgi:sec-independent protein translocase protein TatB